MLIALLALAGAVWVVHVAFSPLVPSQLAATPTAQALAASIAATATAEADLLRPSTPVLEGLAQDVLHIHRCPGSVYDTGRTISSGERFSVFGWGQDVDGTVWVLVKDDIDRPHEWVRVNANLRIRPDNWRSFYPQATQCR